MYRPFKELLVKSVDAVSAEETLDAAFESWRGNNEQVDDVCIAGIRF